MNIIKYVAAVALLSGCASYRAESLPALGLGYVEENPQVEGLQIGCKQFSKEDCKQFLDRDVLSIGVQPIQLTFQNRSDISYYFSIRGMSLPIVEPEDVAKAVHTSTVGRSVGYGALGLFCTPFLIPAIVDGLKSADANKRLDADYKEKSATQLVIAPKSYAQTVLFIPKQYYNPFFDVTLINAETKEVSVIQMLARQ